MASRAFEKAVDQLKLTHGQQSRMFIRMQSNKSAQEIPEPFLQSLMAKTIITP
jgi:hypothetical protein